MGRASFVRYAAPLIFAVGLSGSPSNAQKLGKAEQAAIARSPDEAAQLVTERDDPLDTVATFDTSAFYQRKSGWLGLISGDHLLRAFIDKKTKVKAFQVYIWVTYGGDWRFYNGANYETPAGPESAEFNSLQQRVEGCGRYGCSMREDFTFEVPEAVLREAAQGAKSGDGAAWNFKIFAKNGEAQTGQILKTEIAGLLLRVDLKVASLKS